MKQIRRRALSMVLALVLLMTMLPTTALAVDEPVELDIANGSITITETGYKQGAATDETPYTGAYILTGFYSDDTSTAATAATNQVKISAGSTPIQVTLKDLNIKHHSDRGSGKAANDIFSPIQVLSGTVNLTIEGSSTLIGDGNNSGLYIAQDATAVIKGSGSLICYGGNSAPGIGACQINGGAAGSLIVESGNITAKSGNNAAGIGGAYRFGMQSVTINGGYVDAYGGSASYSIGHGRFSKLANLLITGGTITCSGGGGANKKVTGNTVSVTGGNVGDYYAGTISGRKKTTLYFMNEDNSPKANTEVTVTEGDHTWTAKTDANGKVITYLLNETTSISAAAGAESTNSYAVTKDGVLIGGNCTCDSSGSLAFSDLNSTVEISGGATGRVLSFAANYTKADTCTAPIHPDYTDITYTIDSVLVNAEPVSDPSAYAAIDKTDAGASLYLRFRANEAYTVRVKASAGTDGVQTTQTADVAVNCGAAETASGLDIANGSITVEAGSDNAVIYHQGDNAVYCASDEKLIITGTSSTNTLTVNSGNPTIVLRDVTLSNTSTSCITIKSGSTTLWLEGSNNCTSNATAKVYAILLQAGAKLTIDSEVDEENGTALDVFGEGFSFAEKLELNEVSEPVPVKYKGSLTVSGNGGIGAKTVDQEGTEINIHGGNIDAVVLDKGGRHGVAAIGANSSAQKACSINITGGNVKASSTQLGSIALGGQNATLSITGGCVSAENKKGNTGLNGNDGYSMGGRNCSITIGTNGSQDVSPFVRAVGHGTFPGMGGIQTRVSIHSGTVYASAEGNSAAIGGYYACLSAPITITGGTIGAFNTNSVNGAAIGTRATSAQINNNTSLPTVINITGGKVTTSGIFGGGPYVEGAGQTSSITISDSAQVTHKTGSVMGNVTVESGAELTLNSNIRDNLTVSGQGTNVLINGSVNKSVTGTAESYTRITNSVGGDVSVSGDETVVMIGNSVGGSVSGTGGSRTEVTVNVSGDVSSTGEGTVVIVGGNIEGGSNASDDGAVGIGGTVVGDKNTTGGTELTLYTVNYVNGTSLYRRYTRQTTGESVGSQYPGTDPTKDGYEFRGWNTRADGSGSSVTSRTIVNGGLTAFAQWEETDAHRVQTALSKLVDGSLVVAPGVDKTTAVKAYAEALVKETSFAEKGGTVSVEAGSEDGKYTVTLTLGDVTEGNTKGLTMVIMESGKTAQQKIDEALAALTVANITDGAYNADPLALVTEAVHSALADTEFYKSAGKSVTVTGESGNFRVTLALDGASGIKTLDTTVTLAAPADDAEKAAFALKNVTDTIIRVLNGTSDETVHTTAIETLKQMITPYEGAETNIVILWQYGNVYKVTAAVGTASSSKTVTVTPQYYSSSSGSVTYTVSANNTQNGTLTVNPKNASKGNTVTITVKPDTGYVLDTLTVTDQNDNALKLTQKNETQYTFEMPASKVEIKAAFRQAAETPSEPFEDVHANDYFHSAVMWAVKNGITQGTSATTFSPDVSCTRAQAVTFLWRSAGSPAPKSAEIPFADVTADTYYYNAVLWAVQQGITAGTSDTTFDPNAECTRAQIVSLLYRATGAASADTGHSFADVDTGSYYAEAVNWAVEQKITNGTGNNAFSPNTDCTRAQIVTFLYRAYQGE